MTPSYGELAWRERKEERAAIGAIQGATSLDVIRNNDLPVAWEVTYKGKPAKISADYIMRKTTFQNCAKSLGMETGSIYDHTGYDGEKLRSYYPQWLYETSPKKELFHLLDDKQLDEVRRACELAIQRQVTLNKYIKQLNTSQQMFVGGDKMFILVAQTLLENAIMQASARGSQAVVEQRLKPLLDLCQDTNLSDADFRVRMLTTLLELQSHLHKELPSVFHEELDSWTRRHLRPHVAEELRTLSEEGEEPEDE